MIREFDLRDVTLVRRLAPDGVCLHSETGLTRGINNWLSALRSYVAPGGNTITLVSRNSQTDHTMFGQVQLASRDELAAIYYLAPRISEAIFNDWIEMLEGLTAAAATRGVQYLVAQLDDSSAEYEALRQVGFITYAHQRIWQYQGELPEANGTESGLRPFEERDQFGVTALYQNIVPRLVQQIEPPPDYDEGYVWENEGELTAYFGVSRGPLGIWVRPFLLPMAQAQMDTLLASLLYTLRDVEVPIYASVHNYQGGLQGTLETNGFEPMGYQAIVVKRLGVRVLSPEFTSVAVPEASKISTGPMITDPKIKN